MINSIKYEWKETVSGAYFLPLIDKRLNLQYLDLLQNSYLYNNDDEKAFSVVYKFTGKRPFIKFEEELMKNPLFIGHEDYGDYVLYKFKIPSEFQYHLNLMMNQQLDKLVPLDKDRIRDFAKKRGWFDADEMRLNLNKWKGVPVPNIKDETFVNWISETSFVDANELYKNK